VHRVQDAVCANPAERRAEEAHVTPRHAIERGMGTPQAVAFTGLRSRRRLRRALARVD
jgi:hypothetical protein